MNDGTLKVTPITAAQPQSHAKFSITASIDGFPIQVEVEGKADALRGMIDRLKAIGAQPPQFAQASTPAQAGPTKKAAPICPDHRTPMKASRKPGSYFCPRRTDDGDYCPEKA
jgi:hypothetical protein